MYMRQTSHSPRHSPVRRVRGFTLIELILVMSIIAILAAVALPRLIEAQRDARISKAHAIYGLIRSASALGHARCQLDLANLAPSTTASNCASATPMVNMEGTMVRIINRYPSASADGIDVAAQLSLTSDGLIVSTGSLGVTTRYYDIAGGTAPNCRVSFQEATLSGTIVVAPVISVTTTGC